MDTSQYLPTTWYDQRLELRTSPIHGKGLFATQLIHADEVVMIWGGDVYSDAELPTLKLVGAWSTSVIDEGLHLFAHADAWDYFVNHSCDPNVWVGGDVTITARRTIQSGEEIVGDYAVWDSEPESRFDPCQCGTSLCRKVIRGDDWMRPELQERYKGHFLPFLSRRFAR